jgi:pimeloyl-ACP methyl ester carboxylesterase
MHDIPGSGDGGSRSALTGAWRADVVRVAPGPGRAPLSIAVRTIGRADAPAVLCVHGLTRNGHDFDALGEALAGKYRVSTLDLPGRGDSDRCDDASDYGEPLYLSVLEAVIRHLDAPPLCWIGTSLGAALGMRIAERHPEWVRALVLNDSGPEVDGTALAALRARARERPGFADRVSASAYLRARFVEYGVETEADWSAIERYAWQRDEDGMLRLNFDPRVVSDAPVPPVVDRWALWQGVRCPVLILRGERSRILSRETCERMVAGRRDARWIEIPGAGHAPHLAGAARIGPVIAFLDQATGDSLSTRSTS